MQKYAEKSEPRKKLINTESHVRQRGRHNAQNPKFFNTLLSKSQCCMPPLMCWARPVRRLSIY